jgi:hypothetical protein
MEIVSSLEVSEGRLRNKGKRAFLALKRKRMRAARPGAASTTLLNADWL